MVVVAAAELAHTSTVAAPAAPSSLGAEARLRDSVVMRRIGDPDLVAREYAATERLAARRLDRTAWLHGEDEPWRLALEAIAEARPRRVLDAGCGNGDFAAVIAAPEVVCVDASEAAVEAARRQGLTAQVAALEHLPFGDGTFDLVTCNWVLYHLSDPRPASSR